jgi:hypothetical protein
MTTWREELIEAIKSKAERDAEEDEKRKRRLEEALKIADEAVAKALEGLEFTREQLAAKQQPVKVKKNGGNASFELHGQTLSVDLDRGDAMLKVSFNGGKPREFDFAKDRHISPKDVEEYVGRRAVELARAAQKAKPW